MLWDDTHAPGPETRGKRLAVSHLKGIRIEDLRLFHEFIVAPANRVGLFIHDLVIGELHIFSRKLLAIVPEDSLPQKERDLRFRPWLDLPGFRQNADKFLRFLSYLIRPLKTSPLISLDAESCARIGLRKEASPIELINELIHLHGRTGTHKNDIDPQKDEKRMGEMRRRVLVLRKASFQREYTI